jgi:hypothetical protein
MGSPSRLASPLGHRQGIRGSVARLSTLSSVSQLPGGRAREELSEEVLRLPGPSMACLPATDTFLLSPAPWV